jgi:hypothetical protein
MPWSGAPTTDLKPPQKHWRGSSYYVGINRSMRTVHLGMPKVHEMPQPAVYKLRTHA